MKAVIFALCWLMVSGVRSRAFASASGVHEDIRCFCNLPQCVSTSYICRTERSDSNSGCFSEINDPISKVPARHGCVELLKTGNETLCDNNPQKHTDKENSQAGSRVLFLCCQDDMCNHVDSPANQKLTFELSDQKYIGNHHSTDEPENNLQNVPMSPSLGDANHALFRVATIAVPIFGAIIFFILIAVAIKILRTERTSSSSSKLDNVSELVRKFPLDQEAQITTKQLSHYNKINDNIPSDHCDKKNETCAKINLMNLEYSLLPQNCSDSNIKPNNMNPSADNTCWNNVNLSLGSSSKNSSNLGKIYEKEVLNLLRGNLSSTSNNQTKSYDI